MKSILKSLKVFGSIGISRRSQIKFCLAWIDLILTKLTEGETGR
jgi:hypothetical protein